MEIGMEGGRERDSEKAGLNNVSCMYEGERERKGERERERERERENIQTYGDTDTA